MPSRGVGEATDWLRDVACAIGESVHTALRKSCGSRQAAIAHRAISRMPDEEWTDVVQMAAAQVVRVLKDDGKVTLTAKDKRRLHDWDGC